MSRLRYNRKLASRHLQQQCPAMSEFIASQGPLKLKAADDADLFSALSRAIVYQQLSGKAAGTIYGRFTCLFANGQADAVTCTSFSVDQLRGVGLSRNKALAVHDLAVKSKDGTLRSMRRMARMSNSDVIENLCLVRGIGPWTAQMLLMFNLGRPDVMPATDLGVQKGVQAVYRMRKLPSPEQVLVRTKHLAPYRSAASWYFWRAADTVLMS